MTVSDAGRKGGRETRRRHGHDFYVEIGKKGGDRVRELIEAGKAAETRGAQGDVCRDRVR